jgi:hypothetical protein
MKSSDWGFMRGFFRKIARRLRPKYYTSDIHRKVVSLKPKGTSRGNVLLAYKIEPFILREGAGVLKSHTNYWESRQIADTFLEFGFAVDIISHVNKEFVPKKEYSIFFSSRTHFQRIASSLNGDCKKIVHLDTAHWLFNNCSAYARYLALQRRRGVSLETHKMLTPNWALEVADFASILGNEFTVGTYGYAKKNIFQLPVPAMSVYPSPSDKDFEGCRHKFMWLGSDGLVNKGLDLVLEVFSRAPEKHLTVCGPVERERDFEKAYYKELYETPNINSVGWVDVGGDEFKEIVGNCIGLIYPSCSEGQSGAVVTCMQAGLIPIISYESGVDVKGFGETLRQCTVDEIFDSIQRVSRFPSERMREMAVSTWEYARVNHTREKYAGELKRFLEMVISEPVGKSFPMEAGS